MIANFINPKKPLLHDMWLSFIFLISFFKLKESFLNADATVNQNEENSFISDYVASKNVIENGTNICWVIIKNLIDLCTWGKAIITKILESYEK